MKKIKALLCIFALCIISSCTEASFGAANLPGLFTPVKTSKDIDFGSKYGSKLDIYQPSEVKDSYPVIVFYYGGRWTTGNKNDYKFVAEAFTKRGYIVVIPDYVKYPAQKFPAWQEDAAKSLAWVHKNINAYKGDQWQLYVTGHSAGAQIGGLLATNGQYLYEENLSPKIITAFAGIAGPYDFTPEDADIKDMFGPPENYPYIKTSTFVNGGQPPMLLLWGSKDDVVEYGNIERLESAIRQRGGKVEIKVYEGLDHIDPVASMARLSLVSTPVADDIDEFFKKHRSN